MSQTCNERSKILLLCLGLDVDRTQTNQLTTEALYSIYRTFGKLEKIVLFSRNPLIKAFLEYSDSTSAELALKFTHECFIDNWGRARLYYSALTELTFSNRFIDVLDCNMMDSGLSTTSPKITSNNGMNLKLTVNQPAEDTHNHVTRNGKYHIPDLETQHSTPNDKRWHVGSNEVPARSAFPLINQCFLSVTDEKNLELPLSDRVSVCTDRSFHSHEVATSCVILFSSIDETFSSVTEIFNLFSCFGNIVKVLFMKNIRKALLEFSTPEYAESCMLYMSNRPFGSSKLKLNFSKYQTIDLKKKNLSENSHNFNEVIAVRPEMDRYALADLSVVTPPSPFVLVSCQKLPDIELMDISLMIQEVIKPQSLKLIDQSLEPLDTDIKLRVLFKFSSIAEAMLIIAKVHDTQLSGVIVEASFASHNIPL